MTRMIAALKWMLLIVVTIAVTCGYLTVCDALGFGRAGRWVLVLGMLATAVALFILLIRADIREEDERWADPPRKDPPA